jgi:hypothetical protein
MENRFLTNGGAPNSVNTWNPRITKSCTSIHNKLPNKKKKIILKFKKKKKKKKKKLGFDLQAWIVCLYFVHVALPFL